MHTWSVRRARCCVPVATSVSVSLVLRCVCVKINDNSDMESLTVVYSYRFVLFNTMQRCACQLDTLVSQIPVSIGLPNVSVPNTSKRNCIPLTIKVKRLKNQANMVSIDISVYLPGEVIYAVVIVTDW